MDIRQIDLNLLVVFDALLRTHSVTQAAHELGMSQPATSFALNKLRKTLGDPLFVRTARGIHPTPRAEQLADPLAAVLERIRSDLLQQPTFDPAHTQRTITLNMADIGELVFLPLILRRILAVAPGVDIRTVDLPLSEMEPALRSGAVDLALGYFPKLSSAAVYQQRLFAHSFMCVVRKDHPDIGNGMTRKQFLEGCHAIVQAEGQTNDAIENELRAQGLTRRIALRVEHFLAVPTLLSESDLIFTLPYAIGASLAKLADIKLVRPPFKIRPRIVKQHWHSRFHHDPANRWIRSVIADLFVTTERKMRRAPAPR